MVDDPTPGQGGDEQVEQDPEAMQAAPQLDEDTLDVDPLEAGMDPPDDWSAADGPGTTIREWREGETLDERLAEERPDIEP